MAPDINIWKLLYDSYVNRCTNGCDFRLDDINVTSWQKDRKFTKLFSSLFSMKKFLCCFEYHNIDCNMRLFFIQFQKLIPIVKAMLLKIGMELLELMIHTGCKIVMYPKIMIKMIGAFNMPALQKISFILNIVKPWYKEPLIVDNVVFIQYSSPTNSF